MSDTTADLPVLPPSSADEDIRRALADVDAKLSAWAAAMAEAHAALAGRSKTTTAGPEPSPRPGRPGPGGSVPTAEPVPTVAKPQAPAPIPAPVPAPTSPPPPITPPPVAQVPPTAETPPPAPHSASPADDEALLASLDPETAKTIRVMRRLSFEKKSIRQLLDEYAETRHAQEPAAQRKKSWWSRG